MPKLRSDDGFERHTENSDDGSERQTENSDGFEHQNWKAMMALNAKTENSDGSERQQRCDDGSERRNWGCDSEYRSENQWRLWTPKLNSNDDDHERQTEKW